MTHPSRVRVTGPLISFAAGFAGELTAQGYRPNAAANQLQLMAHLSRWLASEGLDTEDLIPSVVKRFLRARRSQGYTLWLSPKALIPFMDYLRGLGLAPAAPNPPLNPIEELLARYRRYLRETRGLAETSARGYVDGVRPFVARGEPARRRSTRLAGVEWGADQRLRPPRVPRPLSRIGGPANHGAALAAQLPASRGADPAAVGGDSTVRCEFPVGQAAPLPGAGRRRTLAGRLRSANADGPARLRPADAARPSRLARR